MGNPHKWNYYMSTLRDKTSIRKWFASQIELPNWVQWFQITWRAKQTSQMKWYTFSSLLIAGRNSNFILINIFQVMKCLKISKKVLTSYVIDTRIQELLFQQLRYNIFDSFIKLKGLPFEWCKGPDSRLIAPDLTLYL